MSELQLKLSYVDQGKKEKVIESFYERTKEKILKIREKYPTFCDSILKTKLESVKSPTITDIKPPNKTYLLASAQYDSNKRIANEAKKRINQKEKNKRQKEEEQRIIHENSWEKHRNEIAKIKNEDDTAIEEILQEMKSKYPNFSNQKEHTIQIKYVEKTNKHESGVIFEDVTDKKEYLFGLGNIEFAQRIFEGLTGDKLNSNKEIIVKGKKYIELILALRRNATLLGSN
jgi:flagellar biosynthesis GTPase FlhF